MPATTDARLARQTLTKRTHTNHAHTLRGSCSESATLLCQDTHTRTYSRRLLHRQVEHTHPRPAGPNAARRTAWPEPQPTPTLLADVLYFLVGSDEEGRSIPPARVVKFMEESGLMRPIRGGGALRITDKG